MSKSFFMPLLFLAAFSPLRAEESMHVGVQLGTAEAQGDFRNEMNEKRAIDIGIYVSIPVLKSLSIRPTLWFQKFPDLDNSYVYKSSRYSERGGETERWSAWMAGTDLIYHPEVLGKFHVLLGAYEKAWRLHSFGTYTATDNKGTTRSYGVDDTSTRNSLAAGVGMGWSFNHHVSVEARGVFATYRGLGYNTLEASLALQL